MKKYLLPSLKLTVLMILLCAVIYPLLVAFIAKLAPGGGKGVTVEVDGKVAGYENVGQAFRSERYFWSRPSAVDHDASGSGGSNKGPSNKEYLLEVEARIDTFLAHHPSVKREDIPSGMVTASGSGLDPHISKKAALVQAERIASARNLDVKTVSDLIEGHTEGAFLGLFGPADKLNVLEINVALDELQK